MRCEINTKETAYQMFLRSNQDPNFEPLTEEETAKIKSFFTKEEFECLNPWVPYDIDVMRQGCRCKCK